MGGRLLDWLSSGAAADRPLAADVLTATATDSTAFYFAVDTKILSILDQSGPAWYELDAAALAAIAFFTLPDVDATGLADGNVFKYDVGSGTLIPLALAFQTAESIQDLVGAMVANGTGTTGSYDDGAGTFKFDSTITQYTNELAQDAIAAAFAAGSQSGITVAYNDVANSFDFTVSGATYTDENAQDAIAAAIAAGSHTGITIGYNDAGNALSFTVTVTQYTDEMARDAIGTSLVGENGTRITVDDAGDQIKIRSMPYQVGVYSVASAGDAFIAVPLDADDGKAYHVTVRGTPSANTPWQFRVSKDNAATFMSGATDYKGSGSGAISQISMTSTIGSGRAGVAQFDLTGMNGGGVTNRMMALCGTHLTVDSAGSPTAGVIGGCMNGTSDDYNGFEILCTSGNMNDVKIIVTRLY